MIEFEEPEKEYVFEGSNIINNKPKTRLLVLLLTFFVIIGLFVKNEYNFNFFKDNKRILNFICSDESVFNYHDTKEANYERAKKALTNNTSLLKNEKEFTGSGITFKKVSRTRVMRPVIELTFSGETSFNVTKEMCGFKIKSIYK
ncbi:hypothetical protein HN784_04805 [bacterium]|jgi:hypothetical protein|nr:hypothetical protein [bacterium]MBT4251494.1 hypothetical protein [bacterium]MBT4597468.1 hypothetical protein [bacterium]MBT6754307.1 hypothetical protein [bacterium]MBT7037633.1 hypothetical protein [bacterium]